MTSPFPFSSGAVLTSAQLNNIGAYASYTPSGGNWSSVVTVNEAAFAQVNKIVVAKFKITLSGTPTSGLGNFSITQPVVEEGAATWAGSAGGGYIHDASTSYSYPVQAFISGTDIFLRSTPDGAADANVDYNSPIVFASGDELRFFIIYEAD
tara:strand:- start:370 stop:825 length:456 start_codon:yes stop_codon:yes gene_type:complete